MNHRIEGAVTAISSIAHGSHTAGTTQIMRRERFVTPDGSVEDVPVISGNAVRGILRDHSAHVFWRALGRPELPMPLFHALWSGGSLAKAGSGNVLSSTQLARLRSLVPHISLFGAAGGGRIIEGKLLIGKMVPIVTETAHVVPSELLSGKELSVWEHIQIEEFSRMDDAKRASLAPAIMSATPKHGTEQGALLAPEVEPDEKRQGPAQQMRYGVETLISGTRLHWWMQLQGVTDLEVDMFRAALDSWIATGAHLGGRAATGHGRLAMQLDAWASTAPAITSGSPLPEDQDLLVKHVETNREQVLEALSWLD